MVRSRLSEPESLCAHLVVHRPRGALSGWQEQGCVAAPAVIDDP